jgi:hypothetical protein
MTGQRIGPLGFAWPNPFGVVRLGYVLPMQLATRSPNNQSARRCAISRSSADGTCAIG